MCCYYQYLFDLKNNDLPVFSYAFSTLYVPTPGIALNLSLVASIKEIFFYFPIVLNVLALLHYVCLKGSRVL